MTARTQDAGTTTRRSTSRTAAAEKARAKLAAAPSETPAAAPGSEETPKPTLTAVPSETPKPAPQPKPTAQVDLGAKPVTYWFPSAKLSDGTTVTCPHARYGHESEASAKRCISALVASKGHKAG